MDKRAREKYMNKLQHEVPMVHHILNRCKRNIFSAIEDRDNKVTLPRGQHDARHTYHKNETPQETLQNSKRLTQVMSPAAKSLYDALCAMSEEEFYKKKFLK